MASLLIIEDCEHDAIALKRTFQNKKFVSKLEIVPSAEDGLATLLQKAETIDLILIDHHLPGITGLEFCFEMKKMGIELPTILVTGHGNENVAVDALRLGVEDYVIKDKFSTYLDQLNEVIPNILNRIAQQRAKLIAVESLQQSIQELKLENQTLSDFIKSVSHQLNTPLSQLIGFSELLLEDSGELSAEKKGQYLEIIKSISHQAIEMIDISIHNAKRESSFIERIPCQTGRILDRAMQRLDELIKERQAIVKAPGFLPVVMGRPDWIETVWVNLIATGIKKCDRSPIISISYEVLPNGQISFFVCDQHNPIPTPIQKDLDLIFQTPLSSYASETSFFQASSLELELSAVERIIARLGGKSGIKKVIGYGTGYFFTLQKAPIETHKESTQAMRPISRSLSQPLAANPPPVEANQVAK